LKKLEVCVALFFCLAFLSACAHRYENKRLEVFKENSGYRFYADDAIDKNTNSLFVCLTLSGGGTRAAAFSYGVLKALKRKVKWPAGGEREVRLLDEVDVISSISGGSFTAGYYGLFGDGIFADFEEKFLNRNIQGELFWAVLNPINLIRLTSSRFDRIDLAAEIYNETIFQNQTFADIQRRGRRPFIVMNGTNMTTGAQFSFRQEQFDIIGSDLEPYPVANAVAASSAFPLLLSPVTLKNYPEPEGFNLPDWISRGVKDREDNPRRYQVANSLEPYATHKDQHPYVHVVDGGLSDNLGLRLVIDEYRRGFIRQLLKGVGRRGPTERIQKLLVIIVNAKTAPLQDLDLSGSSPGALDVAFKAATVSLDNYTFETVEQMRDDIEARKKMQARVEAVEKWFRDCKLEPPDLPAFKMDPLELFVVELSFDGIKDPEERKRFLNMPTSFKLDPDQVRDLIEVGQTLLEGNLDFQDFLDSLPGK
jgi:NTE family protein